MSLFTWLNAWRSRTSSSLTPPRRRPRWLDLERLEDRVVPATLFADPLGYLTGPQAGAPRDLALTYLQQHAADLGLTAADLSELRVTDQYTDAHNGVTHVYLQQQANGLDVEQGRISVNVTADGRILNVGQGFVSDLRGHGLATTPTLTAQQAVLAAAQTLGLAPAGDLVTQGNPGGTSQAVVFAPAGLSRDPIPVHLVYDYDDVTGAVRLSWQLVINVPTSPDWYQLDVDAATGDLLGWADWTSYDSYNVFAFNKRNPIEDGNATNDDRTVVTNPADPTFSPFGWHDTNGAAGAEFTDTRGNNVFAQEDQNADNAGGARPSGGATLDFNPALNLTVAPSPANTDAATVDLFYWNNLLHDIHAHYGFTEAAGNYQFTNYSGLGTGGDQVFADSQDGSGLNNANFSAPPDGTSGRMQMFLWSTTNPRRDGDFDNQVIVHEYGHGVSTRLTGGPANSGSLNQAQSGSMGEGWSDWWSLSLLAKAGDTATTPQGVGMYVLGQTNNGGGIRRFKYDTDQTVNPLTYGAFRTSSEVHDGGEIWVGALWDAYWAMVNRYGFDANIVSGTGGNNKMLQLVMDGLKLQPSNPTMLQARDAIIQADQVDFGGADRAILWKAFAGRGMGFSANGGASANTVNVTEAFDLPPDLRSNISGQKFLDINRNGVKDATDPRVPGWQVFLDTNGNGTFDAPSAPATFTANPNQSITDNSIRLSALNVSGLTGRRVLKVTVRVNVSHTGDGDLGMALISPNGTRVNLVAGAGGSGDNYTNTIFDDAAGTLIINGAAPFGNTFRPMDRLAKLIGEDPNGQWRLEVWDAGGGDSGTFNSWSLNVTTGDPTATTDATGTYTFADVAPGTYRVFEIMQAGWQQVAPAAGSYATTLAFTQSAANLDFGNIKLNTVYGKVYNDLNGNGVNNADPGLAGWVVYEDVNNNGIREGGEAFTTSDANGNYLLTLTPGSHVLREELQAGWVRTAPGGTGALTVNIPANGIVTNADFGNFKLYTISGRKFNDLDGNGNDNGGTDPGVGGFVFFLDLNNNGVLDAGEPNATTAANGTFSIGNVGPGAMKVREVQQTGWVRTSTNPADVLGVSGTNVGGVTIGNFKLISISGHKFHDLNQDGVQQANEPFLSGFTFYLDQNNNGVKDAGEATAVSDANGLYVFANLGPGAYVVREVGRFNWRQTTANPGPIAARSGQNVSDASAGQGLLKFGNRRFDTFVTGNGSGVAEVNVYDTATGTSRRILLPFESTYGNGVQVATADLGSIGAGGTFTAQLDGVPDIIAAPNAGRLAEILVYDGATFALVRRIQPFGATYTGGVSLATGDVTGDGHTDLVAGAYSGQAKVAVVDFFNNVVRTPFLAFESGFLGGARVAVEDVFGTGRNTLIVGAGAGRSADVKLFSVSATGQGTLVRTITAFAGSTAGVWVTADTGRIIVGDGGGVPEVRIFNPSTGARIGSFYPYTAQQAPRGVRVALTDRDGDGVNEIVTAPGAGGAPYVRFWNLTTLQELAAYSFFAYDQTMLGGVFLGANRRTV